MYAFLHIENCRLNIKGTDKTLLLHTEKEYYFGFFISKFVID